MMNYLLKELYSNNDIESYATSIEYLRKLEEFDEPEIRLKFLLAKNYKLQNQIKELDHKNIGTYLKRSIEINEKVLLDTYNQYNQIFNIASDKFKESNKIDKFSLDFNDSSLLSSWIILKLNNLINELRLGLSHLIKEDQHFFKQLLSIKRQSDKFTPSLLRIGLHFKYHFDLLFNEYLEHDIKLNLNRLTKKFGSSLDSYNIISSHVDLNREKMNNGIEKSKNVLNLVELNPPKSLLQFVPLKNLCNELIRLFDKLASFPATSDVVFKFKLILEEYLKQISIIIEKYIRSETSSLKANERELLVKFKKVYKESLLGHMQNCYKALLGSFKSVDLLGISSIEFNEIKIDDEFINYNELDLNKIYNNV